MFDPVADIEEFHRHFELQYDGPPKPLDFETAEFRMGFMHEELEEYNGHIAKKYEDREDEVVSMVHQLDALVDLVYVALGTAYMQGFDFREAWRRVHAANMKKRRAQHPSESTRGSILDVIKPPGWKPPVLTDLVDPDKNDQPSLL